MSSGIFISYRREDSVAYAGRLYDRLADRFGREHVFMDLDKINPGQDFVEVLDAKIAECDVLIALIGKQWVTSKDSKRRKRLNLPEDFVRMEITSAMDRGALVVPTLVGGARMPRKRDLPEALADFSRRQAIQLRDDRFHDDVDELVETVEAALADGGQTDRSTRSGRRGKLAMLALLALILLGGALAIPMLKSSKPQVTDQALIEALPRTKIEAGSFQMGCRRGDNAECYAEEKPRHEVEISRDFYLGTTEVTVGAFALYAQATGNPMPPSPPFNGNWAQEDHPMVFVTWPAAFAFCDWAGGRLPTDAEWEYAARGGNQYRYPWGDDLGTDNANYGGNDGFEFTAPVGSFAPNGFGLYDMAGNVQEWVADRFDRTYYDASPRVDPPGPESGELRVLRNGSWHDNDQRRLRSSYRDGKAPSSVDSAFGFRCAWSVKPTQE